jgi:hypothetical protein
VITRENWQKFIVRIFSRYFGYEEKKNQKMLSPQKASDSNVVLSKEIVEQIQSQMLKLKK